MSVLRPLAWRLAAEGISWPGACGLAFGCCDISHGYFTSMNFWICCSVDPRARASSTFDEVVGIQGGNQVVVGDGNRSLGLHNLNGVGDSGREAVSGLRQGLVREVEIAPGDSYLVGGRLDVEQSRPDLIVDLAAKIG